MSIIGKPGLSKGFNRRKYLGEAKAPTVRDTLRDLIDAALRDSKSFESFLTAMSSAGCEMKHGKHLAFKIPDAKRFIRLDSLGEDYSEIALQERITGKRIVAPKQKAITPAPTSTKPNLLIDIQEKIQQGKGAGYERWAKIFNLKEAAKTLIFLQERGLTDSDDLSEKAHAATANFNTISDRIKAIEIRLGEISTLQKHIGIYSKTRNVYSEYRDSKWSKAFYTDHKMDIDAHRAAKMYFDSMGMKTLPTMQNLKIEYATLASEKKKLYGGYKAAREDMVALLQAKHNVDRLLGKPSQNDEKRETDRESR